MPLFLPILLRSKQKNICILRNNSALQMLAQDCCLDYCFLALTLQGADLAQWWFSISLCIKHQDIQNNFNFQLHEHFSHYF